MANGATVGRTIIRVPNYEDLVDRVAKFSAFHVAGRQYRAELLIPQLTIRTADLIGEASSCAALQLYWALEAARARRHLAQVEAAYRAWRDRTWCELKMTQIAADSNKLPTDAHCEKLLHHSPEYQGWRARRDDAQAEAEMAEAVAEAFKLKAKLIDAEERILRAESGGAYVVDEDPRQTVGRSPHRAED